MLGARVRSATAGAVTLWRRARADGSYASANDPRVLWGSATAAGAVGVRVPWPSGKTETWSRVPVIGTRGSKKGRGSKQGARCESASVRGCGCLIVSAAAVVACSRVQDRQSASARPDLKSMSLPDVSTAAEPVQAQIRERYDVSASCNRSSRHASGHAGGGLRRTWASC